MATLHLLSQSPFGDARFDTCLAVLAQGDALLLCGDAVYALQGDTPFAHALAALPPGVELYALDEDLSARALPDQHPARPVGYAEFVRLTCQYARVNSWL